MEIEPKPLMQLRVYCDDCSLDSTCLCSAVEDCLRDLQIKADVKRYTDLIDRISAGIPLAPALSINGQVVCMGFGLSRSSIGRLLVMHSGLGAENPVNLQDEPKFHSELPG